jgi:hypothetical protein
LKGYSAGVKTNECLKSSKKKQPGRRQEAGDNRHSQNANSLIPYGWHFGSNPENSIDAFSKKSR